MAKKKRRKRKMKEERDENIEKTIERKMPFGKYRGRKIKNLPIGYLNWLIDNVHESFPDIVELAKLALKNAGDYENLDLDAAADEFLRSHGHPELCITKSRRKRNAKKPKIKK